MKAIALALWIAAAPLLHALTYRVSVRESTGAAASATGTLSARRIDGDARVAPDTRLIRRDIMIPSSGTLPFGEGTWELRVESDRVWAAPVYVDAKSGREALIEAVPAARLQARVGKSGTEGLPPEVRVLLTPQAVQPGGERERPDVLCPLADGQILCTVPAGSWDMRFTATGFIPQFRWNVRLPAHAVTELEPIALVKGAAAVGTVERVGRGGLPADALVRLVPSSVAGHDAARLGRETKPNAKGFFEFSSIAPGEYFITVSSKELTSDSRQIVVIADRTAELRTPLLLDTPKRVRAMISPPLDPENQPWVVSLSVERPGMQHYDSAGTSKAQTNGMWEQKSLRSGKYLLSVTREGNAEWASVPFILGDADVDLQVNVPAVAVKGSVSYGDQPIAARVTFGGEFGSRRQSFAADGEGKFAGVIPTDGKDTWDVFIESDAPPMRRTLSDVKGHRAEDDPALQFDLQIPRTAVLGAIVREDGSPAAHAILSILGNGREFDNVFAQEDGTFQISGLSPGTYRITAEAFLMTSDVITYEVREEENPPLRIVVRDVQKVEGRVITASGVPVIGTSVGALPRDVAFTGISFEHCNESGRFLLQLPSDARLIDLLIIPPGFATVLGRALVRADKFMEITVDQYGGTLLADVPGGAPVMLSSEGSSWPLLSLARAANGLVSSQGGLDRVTVPLLRPGQYSVCIGQRCVNGYLPPHGTLRLSIE